MAIAARCLSDQDQNVSLFCRDDLCQRDDIHLCHDVNESLGRDVFRVFPIDQVTTIETIKSRLQWPRDAVRAGVRWLEDNCWIEPIFDSETRAVGYIVKDAIEANLAAVQLKNLPIQSSWAKERPNIVSAFDDCVLSTLHPWECKVVWQIGRDVRHIWGSATDRSVYRSMKKLCSLGKAHHMLPCGMSWGGYLPIGSKLIKDPFTVREQIHAALCERQHQRLNEI